MATTPSMAPVPPSEPTDGTRRRHRAQWQRPLAENTSQLSGAELIAVRMAVVQRSLDEHERMALKEELVIERNRGRAALLTERLEARAAQSELLAQLAAARDGLAAERKARAVAEAAAAAEHQAAAAAHAEELAAVRADLQQSQEELATLVEVKAKLVAAADADAKQDAKRAEEAGARKAQLAEMEARLRAEDEDDEVREAQLAELQQLMEEDKKADAEREQLIVDLRAAQAAAAAQHKQVRTEYEAELESLRSQLQVASRAAPAVQKQEGNPTERIQCQATVAGDVKRFGESARRAFEKQLVRMLKQHGFTSTPLLVRILDVKSGSIVITYIVESLDNAVGLTAEEVTQLKAMLETTPDWMQSCVDAAIAAETTELFEKSADPTDDLEIAEETTSGAAVTALSKLALEPGSEQTDEPMADTEISPEAENREDRVADENAAAEPGSKPASELHPEDEPVVDAENLEAQGAAPAAEDAAPHTEDAAPAAVDAASEPADSAPEPEDAAAEANAAAEPEPEPEDEDAAPTELTPATEPEPEIHPANDPEPGREQPAVRQDKRENGDQQELLHPGWDPTKWRFREHSFSGGIRNISLGEKSEESGPVADGVTALKTRPDEFIAVYFQSDMVSWPEDQQKYTLISRKGTEGFEPTDVAPDGWMTIVLAEYERLPPISAYPTDALDAFTDSMSYQGVTLHHADNKPLVPGRGHGICDVPALKLMRDINPNDVCQGSVGDCWLLSAISALAEFDGAVKRLFAKTEGIEQMPRDEPNLYTITLFELSTFEAVDVVVDERLAAAADGSGLLGCQPSADGELWPCYLEKAVAAHCGGWDKIDGGHCTHAWALLTGCKEQYMIFSSDDGQTFECFGERESLANSSHDSHWLLPMMWPAVGGAGNQALSADELFDRMCEWDKHNYIIAVSIPPHVCRMW